MAEAAGDATVPDFTPVTLITGFLGSGKTTLLQRLLRDPALADSAVLINELGEIALDHHLLERIDETMVVLQSGCLCCTVRGELSAAIKGLLSKRELGLIPPFRRLIMESTGLADPFPILSTVSADPVLTHHFCVRSVITTVDAVNGASQLDRQPETVKQVAVADRLVVTKTDIAAADRTAALIARLRRINPLASLWHAGDADPGAGAVIVPTAIPARWLPTDVEPGHSHARRGQGVHDHGTSAHEVQAHPSRHDADIRTIALTFDGALDWTTFGIWLTMLVHCHGNEVLRVKGILNVAGSDAPVAVHGVQHLVHPPTHMAAWPDHERRSRLVMIVKGLDPAAIRRSLRAFGLRPIAGADEPDQDHSLPLRLKPRN
ncbi:MAG: GTP-binding protein [Hyphomicrobiaceae bacterium]|nr:GTP-binding protein [Hyphomicrobiaceae bacterium]